MNSPIGDFVDVEVRWDDRSRHGSVLSHRLERTIREVLYPRTWSKLSLQMRKAAAGRTKSAAAALCRIVLADRNAESHQRIVGDAAFWRPNAHLVRIDGFRVASRECRSAIALSAAAHDCSSLRAWLRGGSADNVALDVLTHDLRAALDRIAFRRPMLSHRCRYPLMVGHGCVTWSDGRTRLWIDPFLRPKRMSYPSGQRPISPLDAPEERQVVLITHSHADHFSPASLLLFPHDTTVVVPHVRFETPLALDMHRRARQLGFRDVRSLRWGEQAAFGAFKVTALPFYGEQPMGAHAAWSSRADRNQGSTYHVDGPLGLSALFLADAGADPAGSTLELARSVRRTFGGVDVVFGNHRRWRVFPPQFVTTSVPQNLCYVPDAELAVPQQMMMTPDELQTVGAVLRARHVVPYAMGNAPWFAEVGLGPTPQRGGRIGAFEGRPGETAEAGPDTLVEPSPTFVDLAPGEHIGRAGPARERGFDPIDPKAFPRGAKGPAFAPRSLAIGGPLASQTVRDLLELTRIDPSAYLIASPEFVEIVTKGDTRAAFLWDLMGRVLPRAQWTRWSADPLCAGAFRSDGDWLRRFESAHRNASTALRDGDSGLASVKARVGELRKTVSPRTVEGVLRDLLGISMSIPAWPRARDKRVSDHGIDLPRAAGALVARHGGAEVAAALMIVKLVHNVVLTMAALGRATDEVAAFDHVLGGPRGRAASRKVRA